MKKPTFRVVIEYVREFEADSTEEADEIALTICASIAPRRRGQAKVMHVEEINRRDHINWTDKRLADGTVKRFYYAWHGRSAPRLDGEPGSPEFIASYERAMTNYVNRPLHFRRDKRGTKKQPRPLEVGTADNNSAVPSGTIAKQNVSRDD